MARLARTRVRPSEWRRRRRVLYLCLLLLSCSLVYVLIPGGDQEVDKTAIIPIVAGIVGLVGSYVFGAVWDDKNYMHAIAQNSDPYGFNLSVEEERTEE